MIDYHSELVNTLSAILPTHYEMVLSATTATPCISYLELNNYSTAIGDTLGVSKITYQIKVWGNSIKQIQELSLKIDEALHTIGFKRISSGELYDKESTMIQKILTYEATALEEYK